MRLLMVTPYPPLRDGIAAYALQSVARHRAAGVDVEVLSPDPSAAHHHLDLRSRRGPLALARRVRKYDKVVIQYHPDVFFPVPCDSWRFVATCAGLEAVFRAARDLEVRIHEADYLSGQGDGIAARAARRMWAAAPRIVVHSEEERQAFCAGFGLARGRVQVVDHGADFVPYTTADRASARASLGIPAEEFMFLSIGFIQPHKGFDRAVRAFVGLGGHHCRLDIAGSVRLEDPAYLDYRDELAALAEAAPGVHLHAKWLSDEEFDRWLVACDVVVLPYRTIWSSSVLERAALYDRPVIVTSVGGLQGQSAGRATVVDDDAGLAVAMWAAAGRRGSAEDWELPSDAGLTEVMAAIRGRAAARRGSDDLAASERAAGVPVLRRPEPLAAGAAGRAVKTAVRRLTNWEIEPVYHQLEALRAAVEESEGTGGDGRH